MIKDLLSKIERVRDFLPKSMNEDDLFEILDTILWTPSAGELKEWSFIIVKEKGKKIQVAEACAMNYWLANADFLIVLLTNNSKVKSIFGDRGELYTKQDAAMVALSIMLASIEKGYDSFWMRVFDEEILRRLLKIPDNFEIHGVIALGKALEKDQRKGGDSWYFTFFEEYGRKEENAKI